MHVLFSLFFSWESALLALSFHCSAVFSISYSNAIPQKPKHSSGNETIAFQWKGSGIAEVWGNPSGNVCWGFDCFVTGRCEHTCLYFCLISDYNVATSLTHCSIMRKKNMPNHQSSYHMKHTMVELGFPGGSDSRESVCNAEAGSIPESGSSPGEGIDYPRQDSLAFLLAQMVESTCNAGDPSSIPGSGRPSGEGNGYPVSISNLSNLAWRIPQTEPGLLQSIGSQSRGMAEPITLSLSWLSYVMSWGHLLKHFL